MIIERDWDDEMHGPPIDEATADRLLTGGLCPDDAPPGFASVAGLIQAANGPVARRELVGEAAVVAAALAVVRSNPALHPVPRRRRKMLTKLLNAKVAAIAAGAVLGSTGVAAAATGNLPAPAQSAVANALSHVDVSVPNANSHSAGHGKSGASHGQSAAHSGDDTNGNSDFGLCTAFLAAPNDHANTQATSNTHSGKDDSTAFTRLVAAHGGTTAAATAYCNTVIAQHAADNSTNGNRPNDPGNQPPNTGKPANPGKPAGTGKPANPGQPGNQPPNGGKPANPGQPGASHQP